MEDIFQMQSLWVEKVDIKEALADTFCVVRHKSSDLIVLMKAQITPNIVTQARAIFSRSNRKAYNQ